MSSNEFERDFSERVRQAIEKVAAQADVSPEDALALMTSEADLTDEQLNEVAEEVLSGRVDFTPQD